MVTIWGSATRGCMAFVAAVLVTPHLPAIAADLDDLPPEVREKTQPVHLNWSKQLDRTLEGALHLKGIHLPGRADAPAGTPIDAVHLEGVQAPAELPVAEVGGSALSEAVQSLLVGLLAQGTTSTEGWRQQIEANGLTVADICRVWRRFRQEHPRKGERFGVASSLWAAIAVVVPVDQRNPADLPLDDAFSLGEIQLWGGDGETAQQTFEALLERLPEGPTAGRVSRGLLAYRIAQCRQEASDLEGALDWFLKCAEWGTPEMTRGYDVRSEGYVEAARICRKLGRDEEAQAYYRKAISECTGWGQVVASLDCADELIQGGEDREAERLLAPIAAGSHGSLAATYASWVIGYFSYHRGDSQAAHYHLSATLKRADDLAGMLGGERAAGIAARTRGILERLEAQQKMPPLTAHPRSVELIAGPGRPTPVTRLTVIAASGTPLVVESVPRWLSVSNVDEPVGEHHVGRSQGYEVAVREALTWGTYTGQIRLALHDEVDRTLSIPVRLTVRPELICRPSLWFFGSVTGGQTKTVSVVLSSAAMDFDVVGVEGGDKDLVTVDPVRQESRSWLLHATLRSPKTPGAVEGSVWVRTSVATQPAVEVRYYGEVRPP